MTTFNIDTSSDILSGFTFVANKGIPRIYVGDSDKTTRIYLKGGFESMLGIRPGKRILIAFNSSEKAFAIVRPDSPTVSEHMRAAGYFVSQRKDVSCAVLFRDFKLHEYRAKTFYADETSLNGDVVIFRL